MCGVYYSLVFGFLFGVLWRENQCGGNYSVMHIRRTNEPSLSFLDSVKRA